MAERSAMRTELNRAQAELAEQGKKVKEVVAKLAEVEFERSEAQAAIAEKEATVALLGRDAEKNLERMTGILQEQGQLMDTMQRMQKLLDANGSEIAYLRACAEQEASKRSRIEEANAALVEEKSALATENAALKANIEDAQVLTKRRSDAEAAAEAAKLAAVEQERDAARAEVALLQKNLGDASEKQKRLRERLAASKKKALHLANRQDGAASEKKRLEEEIARLEGVVRSLRESQKTRSMQRTKVQKHKRKENQARNHDDPKQTQPDIPVWMRAEFDDAVF